MMCSLGLVVSSENGQTPSIVQKYLQNRHAFFTDNFYTSPQLYLDLLNGTKMYGKIRQNRKFYPSELRHTIRSVQSISLQLTSRLLLVFGTIGEMLHS